MPTCVLAIMAGNTLSTVSASWALDCIHIHNILVDDLNRDCQRSPIVAFFCAQSQQGSYYSSIR